MKRIIRKLFYIPILPLIIIHYVALPTHWVMEKTLDFVQEIMDQYASSIRKKFPWLIDKNECDMYDQEACKGYSAKTYCNYASLSGTTICPNDLKRESKTVE